MKTECNKFETVDASTVTEEPSTCKAELTKEDLDILKVFPEGTMIESTIGRGGGTEVFIGSFYVQPFSYLGDYEINHYKRVEKLNETEL